MPQDNFDIHEWRLYQSNLNLLTEQDEDDDFNITTDSFDVKELGVGDKISPKMWKEDNGWYGSWAFIQNIRYSSRDNSFIVSFIDLGDYRQYDWNVSALNDYLKPQFQIVPPLTEQDEDDDFNITTDAFDVQELRVGDIITPEMWDVNSTQGKWFISNVDKNKSNWEIIYIGKHEDDEDDDKTWISIKDQNTGEEFSEVINYFNDYLKSKYIVIYSLNEQDEDDFNLNLGPEWGVKELGVGDTIIGDMWDWEKITNWNNQLSGDNPEALNKLIDWWKNIYDEGVTINLIKDDYDPYVQVKSDSINWVISLKTINNLLSPEYKLLKPLTEQDEDDDFNITVDDKWNEKELEVGDYYNEYSGKVYSSEDEIPNEERILTYKIIYIGPNKGKYRNSNYFNNDIITVQPLIGNDKYTYPVNYFNSETGPKINGKVYLNEQDEDDDFNITTDSFDVNELTVGDVITPDMWIDGTFDNTFNKWDESNHKITGVELDNATNNIIVFFGHESILNSVVSRNFLHKHLKPQYRVVLPLNEQDEDEDFNITVGDNWNEKELSVGDYFNEYTGKIYSSEDEVPDNERILTYKIIYIGPNEGEYRDPDYFNSKLDIIVVQLLDTKHRFTYSVDYFNSETGPNINGKVYLNEQDEDDDFNLDLGDNWSVDVELGVGDKITPDMFKSPKEDKLDSYNFEIISFQPNNKVYLRSLKKGWEDVFKISGINELLKPEYQIFPPLNEQDEDEFNITTDSFDTIGIGSTITPDMWKEDKIKEGLKFYSQPQPENMYYSYKDIYDNYVSLSTENQIVTDIFKVKGSGLYLTLTTLDGRNEIKMPSFFLKPEYENKVEKSLNEQDEDDDFNLDLGDNWNEKELSVGDYISDFTGKVYSSEDEVPDNEKNITYKIIYIGPNKGKYKNPNLPDTDVVTIKPLIINDRYTITVKFFNKAFGPKINSRITLNEDEDDDFNITVGPEWGYEELTAGDEITKDMIKDNSIIPFFDWPLKIIRVYDDGNESLLSVQRKLTKKDIFGRKKIVFDEYSDIISNWETHYLKPKYKIVKPLNEQDEDDDFNITVDDKWGVKELTIGDTITPDMWDDYKSKWGSRYSKDAVKFMDDFFSKPHVIKRVVEFDGQIFWWVEGYDSEDWWNEWLKPGFEVVKPLNEQDEDEDDDFNITTDSFDVVELEKGDIITPDMWIPLEEKPGYDRFLNMSPNIVKVIKSIYSKPQKIKSIYWDDLGQEFRFVLEDGNDFWESDLKPKYIIGNLKDINEQDEDDDWNITTDSFDEFELKKGDSITPEMWDLDNPDLDSYIDDPDEDWVIERFNRFGDVELRTETGGHVITSIESINGVLKPKYKIVKSLNELLDSDDDDWNITTDSFDVFELSKGDVIYPDMWERDEDGKVKGLMYLDYNNPLKIKKIINGKVHFNNGYAYNINDINKRLKADEAQIDPPLNEQDKDEDWNITVGDDWNIKDLGIGDIITPDMWKEDIDNTTENVLIRNNVWEIYQMGDYEGIPTVKIKDDNRQIRGYTVRYLNDMLRPQSQIVPNLNEQEDEDWDITTDSFSVQELSVGDVITPDMWNKNLDPEYNDINDWIDNPTENQIIDDVYSSDSGGVGVVFTGDKTNIQNAYSLTDFNKLLDPKFQVILSLNEQDEDDDFNITVGDNWNLTPEEEEILKYYEGDWEKIDGNLVIKSSLDLSNTPITSLPDDLKVEDFLYLSNTKITSLPDNLQVGGYLNLHNTPITSLPDDLKVGGGLYLHNTPITSLPDDLKVGNSLDLSNTKITSLPNNLQVGRDLHLYNTPITSLPDDLKVGGNIFGFKPSLNELLDSDDDFNITVGDNWNLSSEEEEILKYYRGDWEKIGNSLVIKGSLYLSYTNPTSLPNNLKVKGNLNLSNTKITSLPNNLQVGGYLNLSRTKITSLPDNLQVGGWIDLRRTKITSLPNNLQVGGDLDLSRTKITSLPDDLKVGGNLYLENIHITSLPDNLQVGGKIVGFKPSLNELLDSDDDFNITVGDNWNLSSEEEEILKYYRGDWEKIDGNLIIKGSLNLSKVKITSLPDNLQVKGSLYLDRTKITSLPNDLKVGNNLYLINIPITSLPDNLQVGGNLDLSKTKITSLPNDLKVGGNIMGFKPSLNELLDSDDDFNLDLGPEWGFTELRMGDTITPDMWDQEKLNSPGQFVITNPGWFLLPHKITDYKESFSTFITFDNGTKRLSEKFVKSFLKDNVKLDL
jgi:hypothetical protein